MRKLFIFIFSFLLFLANINAQDFKKGDILYASKVKNLSLENGGKSVGRLLPTAKVEVVDISGKNVSLKVTGYVQDGAENAIYYVPNKRILNAAFSRTSGVKPTIIKEVKVEGDKKWYEVEIVVVSTNDDLVGNVEPLYKQANDSYVANCSICHALYQPTKFKANQWPSIVKSMGMRSGLSKEDVYLMTQFLQKNAGDITK